MVKNFQKVNEIVSTGAQPSVEQFSELKSNNYEVVINLSPESTPNYLNNERDVVRDLELEYFHLPIDCTVLKEEQYDDFKRIMDNVRNKKTFIHCGGNIKSSGFYYIYQVKSEGMEKEEAIKPLKELNVHDQKWYDYFKKMGC